MTDSIAPTYAEGSIDLGEQQIPQIPRTRRKKQFLKDLVDNVSVLQRVQARIDRRDLLNATKQINRIGTIRLAANVTQDAPWNVTGMTSTLRHHQVIAVGTMIQWETRDGDDGVTYPRGGIVADDMGLGIHAFSHSSTFQNCEGKRRLTIKRANYLSDSG